MKPLLQFITTLKSLSPLIEFSRKMSSLFLPPASVLGMKTLDRSAFTKDVEVPCLRINAHLLLLPPIMYALKKQTLKIPKIKSFVPADTEGYKFVLLDPDRVATWKDIEDRHLFEQKGISPDDFSRRMITLSWINWNAHQVLQAVIGESAPNVAGFSTVGHIVHLNLRAEHDPFKQVVGEVLLDKIPGCRTVLNKTNVIENEFRNISYEILAGTEDLKTIVRENNCAFHLDYGQVYWNPRLGTEHERLTKEIQPDVVLYDVFAGIGPFAVPAAKKGCTVLANDLNPASFEYLVKNISVNKVGKNVRPFNLDARDFIRTVVKDDMILQWKCNPKASLHIVMNLPASAEDFLNEFPGLLHHCAEFPGAPTCLPPTLHLYCFDKEDDVRGAPFDRVDRNLGCKMDRETIKRHFVRQVAPSKDMLRLVFTLPWQLLTTSPGIRKDNFGTVDHVEALSEDSCETGPESKRRKTE